MIVREYNNSDRQSCITIFQTNTPKFFDSSELADFENWLNGKDENRNSYKNNRYECFNVVVDNGLVIACGGFYVPVDQPRANMVWGMVHADYHGRGIGKELFSYRINQIKTLYPGYKITLDTTQHTHGFFKKLGFQIDGVQKDFYGKGLDRYDMSTTKPL